MRETEIPTKNSHSSMGNPAIPIPRVQSQAPMPFTIKWHLL